MDRNALYLTGLVVVNHLVAAVHAARLDGDAVEDGAAVEASSSPGHLALHWQLLPGGARLALQRRF
jgi:hypothetical protein